MRIALALCLVMGSTFIGQALSASSRRRVALLKNWILGVKMLRIHMSGMLETVDKALRMTDCPAMVQVSENMQNGQSAATAWQSLREKLCRHGNALDALKTSDREVLDNLFENLGQTGRSAQSMHLQSILKQLSDQLENARMQLSECQRLYVTVGFLVGLMLALVVI